MSVKSNIIGRDRWGMPGRLGPPLDLERVTGFTFHHSASRSSDDAVGDLRQTAAFTDRRWGRVSYNYANHRADARSVYMMQGLHRGAHDAGRNSTRIGFLFHGYYHDPVDQRLTDAQVDGAAIAIARIHLAYGVPLDGDGHRDDGSTACPGDGIYGDGIARVMSAARRIVDGDPDPKPPQPPLPDEVAWKYPEAAARLLERGIYSRWTGPGHPVDTDSLSAYLSRTVRHYEGLIGEIVKRVEALEARSGGVELDVDALAAEVAQMLDVTVK